MCERESVCVVPRKESRYVCDARSASVCMCVRERERVCVCMCVSECV